MKEIYFSKDKQSLIKRVSKNLVHFGSEAISRGFPNWTVSLAEKVLCSPTPLKKPLALNGFETTQLEVHDQKIQVYSKGESQRIVIFAHGWSGHAGNFTAFYDRFLAQGYRVVTFDHVAHGNSTGSLANLFLFIKGTQAVFQWAAHQGEIAGIVAHSMGGSAMISAMTEKLASVPLTLIAPVIPLFESLQDSVDNFGISQRWLEGLLGHLENRYSLKIENIDPKNRIKQLQNPLLILQDSGDTYIDLEMNKSYLPKEFLGSLVITEKLGHFRILKASPVVEQALGFIQNVRN
jgi:hypothetical protein